MTVSLTLEELLRAVSAGGPTCLSVSTELRPAAGQYATIAPAVFPARTKGEMPQYAFQRRFLDGESRHAVLVDGKSSQLNRMEAAQQRAIEDGDAVLARVPRIVVTYQRDGEADEFSDLVLPHRAFDGHIRAGEVDGTPVPQTELYRELRNATPRNARALLETSPATLTYGGWDATRRARQGRWPSTVVGEIIGFCAKGTPEHGGGARVDPVEASIRPGKDQLEAMVQAQEAELSQKTANKIREEIKKAKGGKAASASPLGLGSVPPALDQLAGVSCDRIIRSQVLSFATLRQIRFGAGQEGDAACRAMLAALALDGLTRSNDELFLRANCHLTEAEPVSMFLDNRGGEDIVIEPLTPVAAKELLSAAIDHAEAVAGVRWNGVAMSVVGNPDVIRNATSDEAEEVVS